jgi:hypothetical protein
MAGGDDGGRLALPPLPQALTADEPSDLEGTMPAPAAPAAVERGGDVLRPGCWRVRLEGAGETLVGSLRVGREDGGVRVSGDLYAAGEADEGGASPAAGPPIFPRRLHREYLRVTRLARRGDGGVEAAVETHRAGDDHRWAPARLLTVRLWPGAPAAAAPEAATGSDDEAAAPNRWSGEVRQAGGADHEEAAPLRGAGEARDPATGEAGRLTLEWASPWLRRAVLEIDREPGATAPSSDGAGRDWREVLREVGWDVTVVEDDHAVTPPASGVWTDAEVHAAMLDWRAHDDLDREWRFHVLCVERLASTERGLMYDAFAADSNNVPREGLALASEWTFPDEEPWGLVRGRRFGDEPRTYFRTAVHELGHAMGLLHNADDLGFMNTTTAIARRAAAGAFPDNVRWAFAAEDALRLAHLPDPCVRPGGLPFVTAATADAELADPPLPQAPPGLALEVAPVAPSFPLAAPVRVEVTLTHRGDEPLLAPRRLGLKGGHVRGRVVGVDGAGRCRERIFWPLLRCSDDDQLAPMAPGEARRHGLALLRGPDGALFPEPGDYRVEVELAWMPNGRPARLTAATEVTVAPPPDAEGERAAREVLATPDLLLCVALGGDHLPSGLRALAQALDDPVLRPHYAAIEARRLAGRSAPGDRHRAAALCREPTVTAASERGKLERFLADGRLRRLVRCRLIRSLRRLARRLLARRRR